MRRSFPLPLNHARKQFFSSESAIYKINRNLFKEITQDEFKDFIKLPHLNQISGMAKHKFDYYLVDAFNENQCDKSKFKDEQLADLHILSQLKLEYHDHNQMFESAGRTMMTFWKIMCNGCPEIIERVFHSLNEQQLKTITIADFQKMVDVITPTQQRYMVNPTYKPPEPKTRGDCLCTDVALIHLVLFDD